MLKEAIKRQLQAQSDGELQIMSEESPVGESQSNGEIVNAVKRVQSMFRTYRCQFESRYDDSMDG